MAGAVHIEMYFSQSDMFVLFAPGLLLGALVGIKVARTRDQQRPEKSLSGAEFRLRTAVTVAVIALWAVAYLRVINVLRATMDDWLLLIALILVIGFVASTILSAAATCLFFFFRRMFFRKTR